MVSIARPVFETGPKDKVAMVDAYNAVTPEVRNDLTSKLTSFGSTLSETFGAAGRAFNSLGSRIQKGEINVDDAAKRIKSALGGSRSDIASLASGVQNGIYSELTGTVPGTNYVKGATDLFDNVQVVTGQGTYLVNSDRKSVQSVLSFVSDLTGNSIFKTLDLGAEAALIGGLLGTVSSWGVPALMDSLMEGKDDQFKYSVYSRNSDQLISTSNIGMMEYYVDQGMASALTNRTPDYGPSYLAQYTFPVGTTPDKYPELHAQLVKVMDALDPHWFTTYRGTTASVGPDGQTVQTPKPVTNLANLNRVSGDALILLSSVASTRTAVLAAQNFPSKDLVQIAKDMYPMIGIA
jgi:hypothetical protein